MSTTIKNTRHTGTCKILAIILCLIFSTITQAQVQTFRKTTQEINDIDRLQTAVPDARYFNLDTGIYKLGNPDGTIGDIPDRSDFITDTSSVSTAATSVNYWDIFLSVFFKGTISSTLGDILDRAPVWKTDSEITTIDTAKTATENLYYWDSTNSRYCKGLASGELDCWATCVPNCVNKVCGDDGCGGSCGVCLGSCVAGTCEVPAPTTQLLAYYPFDGDHLDISGNDFHGTNSGSTTTTDRNANTSSAYNFDGSNDTVNTPIDETDLAVNNGRDFSIAMWVRPEGWGSCPSANSCSYNKVLLSNRYTSGSIAYGFLFGFTGAGTVAPASPGQLQITIGGGCKLAQVFADNISPLNTWQHVVMSLDYDETAGTSEVLLYSNGVPISTKVRFAESCVAGPWSPGGVIGKSDIYISSAANMTIGNDPAAIANAYYYFDGQMDEIAIYDRALGDLEVESLYNYYLEN